MGLDRREILSHETAGLVLCGGKSSRMGRDKSRLTLNGLTLLDTTRQTMSGVCEMVYTLGKTDCDFTDLYEDKGPAMALFSMLGQARIQDGARLLVMPVDMPLCTVSCLQAILQESRQRESSVYTSDAIMPLVICYSQQGMNNLKQCVKEQPSLSLRRLLNCFGCEAVALPQFADELMNVNNPDDWQQVLDRKGSE
ncbi:molybdenum cofactor guanylyltransferase [Alteromonas sp. 1_MG-2023]|uniref:molybdenum cofactor guanylyltransferase n=1 Tax=Alteromonas sp. 1_MG-2023 TaxID=3062669 RepID=UPI0026E25764|nr:molybdenum cofactor guanylyltransferase [Alteromonas sp. 1_MG-2023]MDO6475782.1 molybdenum cofactor guanylyltransferase [Alteromonas sp. 1_MG-2023]